MAMTAAEVMERANIILQDAGLVRWPAPELCKWLNDGQREICLHKPSACTSDETVSLTAGVAQPMPAGAMSIVRVHRNTSGTAITTIDREDMDRFMPGWADVTVVPAAAAVEHLMWDAATPEVFYVYPSNDGTGEIVLTCAMLPTDVPEPTDPNDPDLIEDYTTTLGLNDAYRSALVDYICFRAYAKDRDDPAAGNRAMTHYQAFATAIGLKVQGQARFNPDMTRGT